MSILVVGSIVYDIIFAVHGNIKNELMVKDGEVQRVNLMFTAKEKQKYFGGTGGNIAYGIGILGGNVYLHGVVGEDFLQDYKSHLGNNNVKLRVKVVKDKFTSTFYGISDEEYQQIGIFQPNVYYDFINEIKLSETLTKQDFNKIEYAIFSPGTGNSTRNHMLELRKKLGNKVKIIFDPSQVLSILFDKETIRECLSLADIFIGNETEMAQLNSIFGYSVNNILETGVQYVVETKGADGSIVYSKDGDRKIGSVKPKRIVETTGAGDAFRAGLLFGLSKGKDIYESCKIGAMMGAKSVEEYGGQLYKIDLQF